MFHIDFMFNKTYFIDNGWSKSEYLPRIGETILIGNAADPRGMDKEELSMRYYTVANVVWINRIAVVIVLKDQRKTMENQ